MTNPTYTDEQVLKCAKTYEGYGEPVCPAMLRSLIAERQRLRERLQIRVTELHAEREKFDLLIKHLMAIHNLLYPPQMTLADGRVMAFRPPNIDPHELLQQLSDEIRAIPYAIDTARATPNETKEAKS